MGVVQGGCGNIKKGKRKYVKSKYQEGKKIEREHAKRSPAEYRDQEAIVQTTCINGAVGVKRKQRGGLKERDEDGC